MSVPLAYVSVIVIWSTTPIAIKWSGEGGGYLFGLTARMVIGALLCFIVMGLFRLKMPWHKRALHSYLAGGCSLYGAMLAVYWGAQFIPSGMISVIYGLTPIVVSVMAAVWLGERCLTVSKVLGMLLGLLGLTVIFGSGVSLGGQAMLGIGAIVASVLIHAASSIFMKRIAHDLPAMAMVSGGALVAVALYLPTWFVLDGTLPSEVSERAVYSIVYLGVFGSVVGFVLYYYMLKRLAATTMALITLITPVSALMLGKLLNSEVISVSVWMGTACILLGLVAHQLGDRVLAKNYSV